jgi:hypothetical protein
LTYLHAEIASSHRVPRDQDQADVDFQITARNGGPLNGLALQQHAEANVRFGSEADIPASPRHVRFTPESGHGSASIPDRRWQGALADAKLKSLGSLQVDHEFELEGELGGKIAGRPGDNLRTHRRSRVPGAQSSQPRYIATRGDALYARISSSTRKSTASLWRANQ